MPAKKTPGRFTLQFNLKDPQQKDAADYLERQGRHKAQFLTSAILHYLHCPETPDIPQTSFPDQVELEGLVLSILRRQDVASAVGNTTSKEAISSVKAENIESNVSGHDMEETLSEAEMSAIFKTLSAFQQT